jgi:hypothetical protein
MFQYIFACHLKIDADPDPDRAYLFDADPDPAYHFDAYPDPAFHFVADPDHRIRNTAPM